MMKYWSWVHFFWLYGNGPITSMVKARVIRSGSSRLKVRLGPTFWQKIEVEAVVIVLAIGALVLA